MYFEHDDDEPLSDSERLSLVCFFVLIVGLFACSVIFEYHPAKLSIVFFLAAWGPLLVLHESAHALVARAVGWRVAHVSIGMGRLVQQLHIGQVPVDVRMFPLEGFVLPVPNLSGRYRLKLALIYFAGPGSELLLLALLAAVAGPDTFLTPADSLAHLALQSVALAIAVGVLFNLVPHTIRTNRGNRHSDGMGIIRSFTLPERYFADWGKQDYGREDCGQDD